MSKHFENLYSNKLENLEETDKFLDAFDLSKLSQEAINHLIRSITRNEIEALIKVFQQEKARTWWIHCQNQQIFKEKHHTLSYSSRKY
jgi:hypothetical protein